MPRLPVANRARAVGRPGRAQDVVQRQPAGQFGEGRVFEKELAAQRVQRIQQRHNLHLVGGAVRHRQRVAAQQREQRVGVAAQRHLRIGEQAQDFGVLGGGVRRVVCVHRQRDVEPAQKLDGARMPAQLLRQQRRLKTQRAPLKTAQCLRLQTLHHGLRRRQLAALDKPGQRRQQQRRHLVRRHLLGPPHQRPRRIRRNNLRLRLNRMRNRLARLLRE